MDQRIVCVQQKEVLNFVDDNTVVTILTVVDVEESKTDVLHSKQSSSLTNERELSPFH